MYFHGNRLHVTLVERAWKLITMIDSIVSKCIACLERCKIYSFMGLMDMWICMIKLRPIYKL